MLTKLLIFILFYLVVNNECKKYRFDYKHYPLIDGWLKHNEVPATWHDARLRCHLEGAELASPVSDAMLSIMRAKILVNTWTGIHATFSKGDYSSIGGVPLLRMPLHWAPGEPDNCDNNEDCITMLPNGTIADVSCNELFPYFCYKRSTSNVMNSCGTLDPNYTYEHRTDSCYKFHNYVQSWRRAFMTCAAEGGYLAIMNTSTETQVLKEKLAKYPKEKIYGLTDYKDDAFIGFQDWGEPGTWVSIHGESLDKLLDTGVIRWAGGQPNNLTRDGLGQSCASITRDGSFNDIWCHVTAAFICEKSPNSLEEDDGY